MDQLLALPLAVPLLAAAAITAAGPLLGDRRRVLDAVAIGVAAATAVILAVIMVRTAGGDKVYWFAGFRPARGVAIGIDFEAGSLSAGLACLAAVLVTAAMTFSWRYFQQVATAVVGALFCFRERHIKRLLAFSTISHAGMFLTGIAVLTPLGLAGTAVYVIGHGLVKAALFLCTGIVLHRLGSVNETWLHGRGRHLRVTGVVFTLAGLGLADLPPFATFLGNGYIDESSWVMPVFIACTVLAGGAVLRVAGGVFYGLGDAPSEDPRMAQMAAEETGETDSGRQRTPLTMIIPAAVLVVAAIAVGLIARLGPVVQAAAVRFEDQAGYNATVLAGAHITHPVALAAAEPAGITLSGVLTGVGSVIGALILAFLALYWRRLPLLRRGYEPGAGLTAPIQRFQSGVVNDYVTWIVFGLACLGGALALILR